MIRIPKREREQIDHTPQMPPTIEERYWSQSLAPHHPVAHARLPHQSWCKQTQPLLKGLAKTVHPIPDSRQRPPRFATRSAPLGDEAKCCAQSFSPIPKVLAILGLINWTKHLRIINSGNKQKHKCYDRCNKPSISSHKVS